MFLASSSADRQRTPLLMSQKIVQLLYKTSTQLGREIYVALLDELCHSFEEVAKEAINWLIYAEDEVRYLAPLIHSVGSDRMALSVNSMFQLLSLSFAVVLSTSAKRINSLRSSCSRNPSRPCSTSLPASFANACQAIRQSHPRRSLLTLWRS